MATFLFFLDLQKNCNFTTLIEFINNPTEVWVSSNHGKCKKDMF